MMSNSTAKERVEAAFRGEITDRIPTCPIVTQSNILLTDVTLREYLTDPKAMAEAQIAGYERYKPDILLVHVGTNGSDWNNKAGQVMDMLDMINSFSVSNNHPMTGQKHQCTLFVPTNSIRLEINPD